MNEEYNKILANEIINTIDKSKDTIIGVILINIFMNVAFFIALCYIIEHQ